MSSYRRIVVGTDGSDSARRAVEHAAWLAERTGDSGQREVLVMFKTNKDRLSFLKVLKGLYAGMQQTLNFQTKEPPTHE